MTQPVRILLALAAGLLIGIVVARVAPELVEPTAAIADPVGGLWLDALRMTIVPLIVALVITGIAASTEAARASRLAGRAVILFMAILWCSALIGALLTPLLLGLWPMPGESATALRAAMAGTSEEVGEIPTVAQFVRSLVPTNPIAAAANDQILPLIFFTIVFAFA
ncbi:MAG TPA: cation:dicarboxylase symporter family transporter, partial [Allosphingosinicella sp.]